jgi:hypothetical protein
MIDVILYIHEYGTLQAFIFILRRQVEEEGMNQTRVYVYMNCHKTS